MKVSLNTINDVKTFVDAMEHLPIEADLVSGRYSIDAKSLMGVFSLDWSSPVEIVFHGKLTDEDYGKIERFVTE